MIRRLLLWLLPLRFEHTFKDGDHTITEYKQLGKQRVIIRQYQGPPEHWNCNCYLTPDDTLTVDHLNRIILKTKVWP